MERGMSFNFSITAAIEMLKDVPLISASPFGCNDGLGVQEFLDLAYQHW
jgi:hypothetical protein